MEIKKVKGIVISETNYSESSKILNVITLEHGKIGVIAKGCRKLNSSLRSVSSKFTYGYFNIYYKEDGLSTLISVDVIDEFINIKKDLLKIGISYFLLDLTDQVLKDTNSKDIFPILEAALIKINDGYDALTICNIVQIKYLDFLGVMPTLDGCAICGKDKDIVTISGDDGGYICRNCYTNQYITDIKTIKLIKMFSLVDISKIKSIKIQDKNKKEINTFLDNYYDRYTGLYLKSKNFLTQIL